MSNHTFWKKKLNDKFYEKKNKNPQYSIRALARDLKLPYITVQRILTTSKKINANHAFRIGIYLKIPKETLLDLIFLDEND